MSTITQQYTAVTGGILTAARWNTEFSNIIDDYNGGITNANINASAGIAYSKLDLGNSIVNADVSATAAIAASKLSLGISGSVVGDTDTQTLTNKTLTSPIINTANSTGSYEAWKTDTYGSTITFDLSTGNKHRVTLTGNPSLAVSNVQGGHVFIIELIQDGTGGRTVGWFGGINWAGGSAPTLTTTASKADLFGFIQDATDSYIGLVLGGNI